MSASKRGIFKRFSGAGCRIRGNPFTGKAPRRKYYAEFGPVIDADFVEVEEGFEDDSCISPGFDPELIENIREYLKNRSKGELVEIFEEIGRILEDRYAESESFGASEEEASDNKRARMNEIPKNAFRIFSKTASCGKERLIKVSKNVSSKASTIAFEGKESIKLSSKKINDKWSNLSPGDRKIISELIITMIEIGLLKNSTKGKKAAFTVLSSICRHQTPGKRDIEEFIEGLSRVFKRRR